MRSKEHETKREHLFGSNEFSHVKREDDDDDEDVARNSF